VTFLESGLSLLVGTCDRDLQPEAVRAVGLRVWPGSSQLTIYLAAATSARAVANARETRQLAVTLSYPPTHRTLQIKGPVRDVREAGPAERELVDRYIEAFADNLAIVGLPRSTTRRMTRWPAFAVDIDIGEVFGQTPGPGAGNRMQSP
jgi:hypothetical protein